MSCLARRLGVVVLAALLASCAPRGPIAPDFMLTDDRGRTWTLSAQRGTPVLLTFGFTHCLDTCPETLAKLAHVTKTAGHPVSIAMVTVDPRRDTPAALHAFVRRFDAPVIGLTGMPARTHAVERAYGVWSQPIPGPHGTGDVAHTAAIYFIDATGRLRGMHRDGESIAELSRALRDMDT